MDKRISLADTSITQATVLSKAAEYIAHIERRNKTLTKEKNALKSRLEAFELLMISRDPELAQEQQRQESQRQQQRHMPQKQRPRNVRTQLIQGSNSRFGME